MTAPTTAAARTRPSVPTDEPVRGVLAYLEHPGILRLSGMEQTRRFERDELPVGPLWYLTGLHLIEANIGRVTWQLPLIPWFRSPADVVPGGVLAFAADGALANAIQTALGPHRVVATADLAVNFVRPPDPAAQAVTVTAHLIHLGHGQGLSEATVSDTRGHLLAHATTRCMVIDIPGDLPPPPPFPVPRPSYEGQHPFQRAPAGQPLPPQLWHEMTGLQMLNGWRHGELPRSPLSNLLGTEVRDAAEGYVECEIPASPWFVNVGGTLYGGLLALFADYTINGVVQSAVPPGTSWATLDLKVRFIRPVPADGRPLRARARILHRGRRLAVASAELVTADDKPAAFVDASLLLFPGRPWSESVAVIDQRLPTGDAAALRDSLSS